MLNIRGYSVLCSSIPNFAEIKKKLTITPRKCEGYSTDIVEPYILYQLIDDVEPPYLVIPMHFGLTMFGIPDKLAFKHVEKVTIKFAGTEQLRDYQTMIIDKYMAEVVGRPCGGGIISVGCGKGKTVMALNIAAKLGVKTLILVHKEFLAHQWKERAAQFLSQVRIGFIQGKQFDVHNKDIVIGMIQSLSDPRKDNDFPAIIFKQFGLVIVDECHHLGARQFCRVLTKWCIPYTLGLSATPKRTDGCENVFYYYLGNIIYSDAATSFGATSTADDPDAIVKRYLFACNTPAYCRAVVNYRHKPNTIAMETNITTFAPRTQFIANLIPDLISDGRTILLLSSRLDHITVLTQMISALIIARRTSEDGWDGVAVGLYLGGMKQRDLNVSAAQRIIIATYIMAEEAFDCPSLNTLILTTPKKNIVQSIGRIMRKTKTERSHVPLIIDIMDEFSNFYNWNRIRLTTYRKHRYLIENYEVAQDDASPEIQTITQKPTIYANTAAATAEVDAIGHSKRACAAADSDDDDEYDC